MGFQIVSHVLSLAISLVTTGILSRYLGVDAYGQMNYLFAFYYFFMVFNDLGIDVVVIREISKYPEKAPHIIGAVRTLRVIMSLGLLLIAWTILGLIQFTPSLRQALIIFGFILPVQAMQSSSVIFNAKLKLEYGAVIGWVNRVVHLSLVILFVAKGFGLWAFALNAVLCELASLGLILYFGQAHVRPKWRFDFEIYKKIFHSSIPIAITGIFVALVNRMDYLMLERMSNFHEIGFYSAAYQIAHTVEILPGMIMATIYPIMSRTIQERPWGLSLIYKKTMLLLSTTGLTAGILVSFLGPKVIPIIFGEEFISAAHVLTRLIWSSVFIYLSIASGYLIITMGKEKINVFTLGVATLINFILNLLWIPSHGIIGAATATVCAYGAIFIIQTSAACVYLKRGDFLPKSAA